jgi:hypothetical protein
MGPGEHLDLNECRCDCHTDGGLIQTQHCGPCCSKCPHCGKRVLSLDLHVREAHPEKVLLDLRGKPDSFSLGGH